MITSVVCLDAEVLHPHRFWAAFGLSRNRYRFLLRQLFRWHSRMLGQCLRRLFQTNGHPCPVPRRQVCYARVNSILGHWIDLTVCEVIRVRSVRVHELVALHAKEGTTTEKVGGTYLFRPP